MSDVINPRTIFVVIVWILFAIDTACLAARFIVRTIRETLGFDDWAMLGGWLVHLPCAVLVTYKAAEDSLGLEPHLLTDSPDVFTGDLKAPIVLLVAAITFSKCSVALLLLRILEGSRHWQRALVWTVTAVLVLATIPAIVLFLGNQCRSLPEARRGMEYCVQQSLADDVLSAQAAWGAFVDFMLALLPLTFVPRLQMTLLKRSIICMLFGLGIVTSAFAALKIQAFYEAINPAESQTSTFHYLLYTVLELSSLGTLGSIPACYPLYYWLATGQSIKPPAASTKSHLLTDSPWTCPTTRPGSSPAPLLLAAEARDVYLRPASYVVALEEMLPRTPVTTPTALSPRSSISQVQDR